MLQRLRERKEWRFFAALPKADRRLALTWWAVVWLHGLLPALFAIAMGGLVAAVQHDQALAGPLGLVGVAFVLLQVLTPVQTAVSHNLGDRTAAYLYDRLTGMAVRPPGVAHLENPSLAADLTAARDFDLGMTGPPLSVSMDFIAGGLIELIGGLACACVLAAYAWWAPFVLGGAMGRHALAASRERGLARPQYRRSARCPARRRLRLSPGRRSGTGQPRSCACSDSRPGSSIDSRPVAERICTTCSTRPRGCASGPSSGACSS
jgi:hypothetical protein